MISSERDENVYGCEGDDGLSGGEGNDVLYAEQVGKKGLILARICGSAGRPPIGARGPEKGTVLILTVLGRCRSFDACRAPLGPSKLG